MTGIIPTRRRMAVTSIAVAALGVAAVAIAARRAGISLRAWLVLAAVPLVAPDLDGEGAIARAIAQDRARGPGRPSVRLRKRLDFREEVRGTDRLFRLSAREGVSRLRFLYLHGGAYILDLQSMQWAMAAGLLDRLGGDVVAPIYPLGPEQGWRDTLEAVERIYLDLANEKGGGEIVVFGDSAGGGLALALAQRLRDAGLPLPSSLVLFSPWLDIGVSGNDQPALEERDPALSIAFLREAGQLWAGDLSPNDPHVSPLFGDQHGLPPTIMFSGTRDILDSDALRLAALNPAIDHRHYRNMIHVWPCAPIPEAKRALDEAASFVRQHLVATVVG